MDWYTGFLEEWKDTASYVIQLWIEVKPHQTNNLKLPECCAMEWLHTHDVKPKST
jgi:hypothetical protein